MKDTWRTYDGRQATQVISGLQYLIDNRVLGEEEEEVARRIQRRLRNASMSSETTMIPFSNEEEELLSQVEATLWR